VPSFLASGRLLGGLAGILFGSALMFVPVVGHIVVLDPSQQSLWRPARSCACWWRQRLGRSPDAIGIPKDSVLRYETALKADKFLLVVHGDSQKLKRAHEILVAHWPISITTVLPERRRSYISDAALANTFTRHFIN